VPHEKNTEEHAIGGKEVALSTVPPYDFHLSTALFASESHISLADLYGEVLRLEGIPVLALVRSTGSVDSPILQMEVKAKDPPCPARIEEARIIMQSVLNLSLDLSPFYSYIRNDPVLARITITLRGLKPRKTPTIFEVLVRSIIEQQISLSAAHRIQERLIHSFGEPLILGRETYFVFPTPETLALTTEEGLRNCGLSRNKASYIRGIARSITDGSFALEDLASEQEADIICSTLKAIRGVGNWTAEMVMLRGIGIYETFPADDLGLLRTLSRFYRTGEPITPDEARELSDHWGPWKGLAAFYLIVAELQGLVFPLLPY
jgi:DNA-3-methyladenine glycosylase II